MNESKLTLNARHNLNVHETFIRQMLFLGSVCIFSTSYVRSIYFLCFFFKKFFFKEAVTQDIFYWYFREDNLKLRKRSWQICLLVFFFYFFLFQNWNFGNFVFSNLLLLKFLGLLRKIKLMTECLSYERVFI